MDSHIYTVSGLTRILRVIGDHVTQKSDLDLLMGLFQKWRCLVYIHLLSCVRDLLRMLFKYRQPTSTLLISGTSKVQVF